MKQVVVEGKETKKHRQDSNSPTYSSSNGKKKNRKNEKNADSDQRHRCKEQTFGHSGRTVRMGWFEREKSNETCILLYVKQMTGTSSMKQGTQSWCSGG